MDTECDHSQFLTECEHAIDKSRQKGRTDEDDEIGGEKSHDKQKGIFQAVSRYEKMDSESKKKTACRRENDLANPP
jgi:hypothetical protein